MTSKEAYYILIQAWHGNKDTYDYPSFDDINEAFDTLKQDLERLEALESNSDKVIKDSVKLINKNLELQARLEVLEIENQDLKDNEKIITDYGFNLIQENEKLKKVIEIYTKLSTIDKECTTSYLVRNGMITQQEYELLKEVLGDERN